MAAFDQSGGDRAAEVSGVYVVAISRSSCLPKRHATRPNGGTAPTEPDMPRRTRLARKCAHAFARTSSVDVQAERHPTGIAQLHHFLQRMKTRSLHVAEVTLEAEFAIEPGAACGVHRLFDCADGRAREDGTARHDTVCRLLAGLGYGRGFDHVAMGKPGRGELVFHLANY
jgi:hypothetical protein